MNISFHCQSWRYSKWSNETSSLRCPTRSIIFEFLVIVIQSTGLKSMQFPFWLSFQSDFQKNSFDFNFDPLFDGFDQLNIFKSDLFNRKSEQQCRTVWKNREVSRRWWKNVHEYLIEFFEHRSFSFVFVRNKNGMVFSLLSNKTEMSRSWNDLTDRYQVREYRSFAFL